MTIRRRHNSVPVKKLVVVLLVALMSCTAMSFSVKALSPAQAINQIEVVGYEDDVDYYHQMKECAKDGSGYAMIVGAIYEKQRNLKIDQLNLSHEKTQFFVDYHTGEDILRAMDENMKSPLQKKIDRLKSEHNAAGQVYEYLNAKGMSDVVIAGILGNMMAECGGQTLDLKWNTYGFDGSSYYGLCQWSLYYCPAVDGASIVGQLDYLMSNIHTNMNYFGGNYDDFCAIDDPGAAAKYFCNYYERGSGTSVRAANAQAAFAWIQAK